MPMNLRSINPPPPKPLSAHGAFRVVRAAAMDITREDIVVEDIPAEFALQVIMSVEAHPPFTDRSLRVSYNSITGQMLLKPRPNRIHTSCQWWLQLEHAEMAVSGWLNPQELRLLQKEAGTSERFQVAVVLAYIHEPANLGVAIHAFNPPYLGSVKEPDAFWHIKGEAVPSLVVEMGWSGSYPKRLSDMDVWMVGAPQTRVGILVNFNSRDGGVASDVEIFRPTATGIGHAVGPRIDLFPPPDPSHTQLIPVTRGELFGNHLVQGRNAADVWNLDAARLRNDVEFGLRDEGYIPLGL